MDAGSTHDNGSLLMRLGEHTVRGFAMALVLTGQMLPAGSVSAEESPLPPSTSAPVSYTQAPTPLADEEVTPVANGLADQAPADLAPAIVPELTPSEAQPVEAKELEAQTPDAVDDEVRVAAKKMADAAKAAAKEALPPTHETESLPLLAPAPSEPVILAQTEGEHSFGDWTMTIRPGAARTAPTPCIQSAMPEAPQASVSVPITVNINNSTPSQSWFPAQWGDTHAWNAVPTSAYLFQRPQPYWQQRSDFYHLRPFIPGLW